MTRGLVVAGLLVLLSSLGALAGQQPGKAAAAPQQQEEFNDTIRLVDNNPITPVRVVEDRWDAVVYKLPGVSADGTPCPADTVEGVDYASRPAEYETAQELKRTGKFEEAVRTYDAGLKKLKADEGAQRQYFQMGKIECFAALRKSDEVQKLVNEILKSGNPPRLIFEAYLQLGATYYRARKFYPEAHGAYESAAKLFDDLENKAAKTSSGRGGLEKRIHRYALEAKLGRIRCLEMAGMIEGLGDKGAESAYQIFTGRAATYPDLVAQAQIGMGRCMALRKNYKAAIEYLEDLANRGGEIGASRGDKMPLFPAEQLPALYAAIGDAYLARAGSENKDELDYYKGRWYYLKVVVQLPTDREAVAHAYYGAGLCYEALSREVDSTERKVKMFEMVANDFPDSPEYVLAVEKLGRG